jgi:hypothetical protein
MQRKGKKGSKSTLRRNQPPARGSNTNEDPPSPPYRPNAPVESGGGAALQRGPSFGQAYQGQGFGPQPTFQRAPSFGQAYQGQGFGPEPTFQRGPSFGGPGSIQRGPSFGGPGSVQRAPSFGQAQPSAGGGGSFHFGTGNQFPPTVVTPGMFGPPPQLKRAPQSLGIKPHPPPGPPPASSIPNHPPQFYPRVNAPSTYHQLLEEHGAPEAQVRRPYDPSNSFRPYQNQGAAAAPRKSKKNQPKKSYTRFSELPSSGKVNLSNSNTNNEPTQMQNESSAAVRSRKKKAASSREKGERYGHGAKMENARPGTLFDPSGPWAYMPKTKVLGQAALEHFANTYGQPEIARQKRRNYAKKYRHPTGANAWLVSSETGWGPEQATLHKKAISSLKNTMRDPDVALLTAIRADLIHSTRGVPNNVEMGTVVPRQTLAFAKSVVKHKGSITKLNVDLSDDSARLENFELYCVQLTTAREGQAWVAAQLDKGTTSKSGKHVRVYHNLTSIDEFYRCQEAIAEANIRALKETQLEGLGYDRIDRFIYNIAFLQIHFSFVRFCRRFPSFP